MKKIYRCCQDVDYFPVTPRLQVICSSCGGTPHHSERIIQLEEWMRQFFPFYVVKWNAVDELHYAVLTFSRNSYTLFSSSPPPAFYKHIKVVKFHNNSTVSAAEEL